MQTNIIGTGNSEKRRASLYTEVATLSRSQLNDGRTGRRKEECPTALGRGNN